MLKVSLRDKSETRRPVNDRINRRSTQNKRNTSLVKLITAGEEMSSTRPGRGCEPSLVAGIIYYELLPPAQNHQFGALLPTSDETLARSREKTLEFINRKGENSIITSSKYIKRGAGARVTVNSNFHVNRAARGRSPRRRRGINLSGGLSSSSHHAFQHVISNIKDLIRRLRLLAESPLEFLNPIKDLASGLLGPATCFAAAGIDRDFFVNFVTSTFVMIIISNDDFTDETTNRHYGFKKDIAEVAAIRINVYCYVYVCGTPAADNSTRMHRAVARASLTISQSHKLLWKVTVLCLFRVYRVRVIRYPNVCPATVVPVGNPRQLCSNSGYDYFWLSPPPVYLRDKSKWSAVSADGNRLHASNLMDSIKMTVSSIQDYRNFTKLLINGKILSHTWTDEVKNDPINQGFPIYSVHRLHGRDGRPLSLHQTATRGLSRPIKKEDQDSAIDAKNTGMQLLTAMLSHDVLSARSLIGLKSALAQGSPTANLHVRCMAVTTQQTIGDALELQNSQNIPDGLTKSGLLGNHLQLITSKITLLWETKLRELLPQGKDWGRTLSGYSHPSGYFVLIGIIIMSEAPGHAQPRYVKCPVPHWTKECNRTKEAGDEPSCCNCGQKHTPNYGGCPRRADPTKQLTDTIARDTIWRECPKPSRIPRSAGTAASAFGKDSSTIMAIFQVVRNAEVSNLTAKFRKATHGIDRLKIILGTIEIEILAGDLYFNIITPLTPIYYPNNDNHRLDILDIALMRAPPVSLFGSLTRTHEVSAALEEIDTPILNSIPNIVSTDNIDNAIGALTDHIRTVVENTSRTVPAKSDRRELPRDKKSLEGEILYRVSLPPKDDLDPITRDETGQYLLVNETYQSWGTSWLYALSTTSAYVNDIPRTSTGVQLAWFADDLALYLKSNTIGNIILRLQKAIDELTQWLRL
ncbi:hypothetical protein EVAR_54970_1 [Eumeta japonica]|uniref:Uncharacterized protein n=1 Tax=Eumeta variegata TaxID=151549 RepID=A0A4C1YMG9_EUMVA|nr:hypothetical protein EVAR_54970_1 [Eumeta japonica]